jgi:phosphoribosylanthranilate isomerase
MFLKVCGITRLEDAEHAVACGATALGFVFWPRSPRYIAPEAAASIVARVPAGVTTVGVFVNEPVAGIRDAVRAAGVSTVQLHGDEPVSYAAALAQPLLRALDVDAALDDGWPPETTILLDAADRERRGGTGARVDWARAEEVARRRQVVLAGGLTPENVETAIDQVGPWGVDVSSGVESAPGVKDAVRVNEFLRRARLAFARRGR